MEDGSDNYIGDGVPVANSANNLIYEKSKQSNLLPVSYNGPKYRLAQLTPKGNQTLTLANAVQNSYFQIDGNQVFNLSRSFIVMDCDFLNETANTYSSIHTDSIPLSTIQLIPGNSTAVVDVDNAQEYSKVAHPLSIDLEEYMSRSPVSPGATMAEAYGSVCMGLQPCDVGLEAQYATASLNAGYINPAYMTQSTAGVMTVSAQLRQNYAASASASVPRVQAYTTATGGVVTPAPTFVSLQQNVYPSAESGVDTNGKSVQRVATAPTVGAAAPNGTHFVVRYKFPLKAFSGSILAMDRDLYFGSNLVNLKLGWQALSQWGFISDLVGGNVDDLPSPTVSNYYLYLAVEENMSLAGELIDKYDSGGYILNVPYLISNSTTTDANTGKKSIATPLEPGDGDRIKRIITVAMNGDNTQNSTCCADNVNSHMWSQIRTKIGANYIQDYPLAVSDNSLWYNMQDILAKTPAGMTCRNYLINAMFIDNFSDTDGAEKFQENDTKDSGRPIDKSTNYIAEITQAATVPLNLYQFTVLSKKLKISPGKKGVSFLSDE